MRTRLFAALAALALASACDPPDVSRSTDSLADGAQGRIEGQVVVQSHARGNAVVFLFRADAPPPPEGSGRPISFTVVPRDVLFGSAANDPSSAGPFVAPFQLSLVPSGGPYLLRGFIDADTCVGTSGPCHGSDFIPWYGVTDEPNAGDVGGAAIDPDTGKELAITVGDTAPLVAHASVLFSDAARIPMDRPVFSASGDGTYDPSKGVQDITLTPLSLEQAPIHEANPAFVVQYVDQNHDGVPDDSNGDGFKDFWPKVFVRKLADSGPPLADENDLNQDGVLDATGVDYARLGGTTDGKPDAVFLGAAILPGPVDDALTNPDGTSNMGPATVPTLTLVLKPFALDASNPAAPVPLQNVPSGRYAITLIEPTGQTWRVPNELEPGYADLIGVGDLGLPALASQSFVITVP